MVRRTVGPALLLGSVLACQVVLDIASDPRVEDRAQPIVDASEEAPPVDATPPREDARPPARCDGGLCEREVVSPLVELRGSTCLMRHDDRVYLADGDDVVSFSVAGDPAKRMLSKVSEGDQCQELRVFDGKLILARWNEILRMNLDGSQPETLWSTTNPLEVVTRMNVVDHWLYFTTRADLRRLDLAAPSTATIVETNALGANCIEETNGVLFFATKFEPANDLRRLPLDGGPSTTHVTAPGPIYRIRATGDTLTVLCGASLYRGSAAPGSNLVLVSAALGIGRGRDLVMRGPLAYVSMSGETGNLDGSIDRVDIMTGERITIARGGFTYMDIAVDDTHVYFGDFDRTTGAPRLVRVPR